MKESDRRLVETLKSRLPENTRSHISQVIVFGSRARGEAGEDSDLDVAILVDNKTPEIERAIDDAAYSVMWDNDFTPIVSLKVFQEAKFRKAAEQGFSFYLHVTREGIAI